MENNETTPKAADRYLIAKDYKSAQGRQVWGVYDDETKKIVESGFFSKDAARASAARWNQEAK